MQGFSRAKGFQHDHHGSRKPCSLLFPLGIYLRSGWYSPAGREFPPIFSHGEQRHLELLSNVKYPHIPWNAHRNKFRPSEGWQLLPMRFFSSEKSRGCPSVSLEVFPWGFFLQPSQPLRTSPHARGCAEAPLCCTQTLLPSLFPPKNLFSSGIEGKHRAQLSFPSAPQCQVPQKG